MRRCAVRGAGWGGRAVSITRAGALSTSTSSAGRSIAPDVTAAQLIGEGCFHQLHGGTTTNVSTEKRDASLAKYRQQYRRNSRARGRDNQEDVPVYGAPAQRRLADPQKDIRRSSTALHKLQAARVTSRNAQGRRLPLAPNRQPLQPRVALALGPDVGRSPRAGLCRPCALSTRCQGILGVGG